MEVGVEVRVVVIVWRSWRMGDGDGGGGGGDGEDGEEHGDVDGEEDWGALSVAAASATEMTDEVEHGDARACARASSILPSNRSQSVTFLSPISSVASHGSSVGRNGRRAGRNACCGASLKLEKSALVGIAEFVAEVEEDKSPEMRRTREVEVCIVFCVLVLDVLAVNRLLLVRYVQVYYAPTGMVCSVSSMLYPE